MIKVEKPDLKAQTAVAFPLASKATFGSVALITVEGETTIGIDQLVDPMGKYADSIKNSWLKNSDQRASALPDTSTATAYEYKAAEPGEDPGVEISTGTDQLPPINRDASIKSEGPTISFHMATATPVGFTESAGGAFATGPERVLVVASQVPPENVLDWIIVSVSCIQTATPLPDASSPIRGFSESLVVSERLVIFVQAEALKGRVPA